MTQNIPKSIRRPFLACSCPDGYESHVLVEEFLISSRPEAVSVESEFNHRQTELDVLVRNRKKGNARRRATLPDLM